MVTFDPVPVEIARRQNSLFDLHREWIASRIPGPFNPEDWPSDSDYNIHTFDIEASADEADGFYESADVLFSTQLASLSPALARTYKRDKDGKFGSGTGGVRDALAGARTTSDVAAATHDELQRIMGRSIEVDLKGMDVGLAREHMEGILRGAERHPQAQLTAVTTYGPKGVIRRHPADPTGQVAFGISSSYGEISFNVHDAPGVYRGKLDLAQKVGYGVAEGPMGVALHEFGHIVTQNGDAPGLAYRTAVASAAKAGQDVTTHVRQEVSYYAADSHHELVGESYAAVMQSGDRAPQLARDVMDDVDYAYARETAPRALLYLTVLGRTYKRDKDGRFGRGTGAAVEGASAGEMAVSDRLNGGYKIDQADPDPANLRVKGAIRKWAEGGNAGAGLSVEIQDALGPGGNPMADTEGAAFVRTIATSSPSAPVLYRGMKEVRPGSQPREGDVIELGPTSFSRSKKIRDRFAQPDTDDTGVPTMVHVTLKPGSRSLRIDQEVSSLDEKEHVALGKFRVTGYKESEVDVKAKDGTTKRVTKYEIEIEQIEPSEAVTVASTKQLVTSGGGGE